MSSRPPRWQVILLAVHRSPPHARYAERLIRQVKGSRTHLRAVIQRLITLELLQILPRGRVKELALTPKGVKVVATLHDLREHLPFHNTETPP